MTQEQTAIPAEAKGSMSKPQDAKLKLAQRRVVELEKKLKLQVLAAKTAEQRIKNHLSYRLGTVVIQNSNPLKWPLLVFRLYAERRAFYVMKYELKTKSPLAGDPLRRWARLHKRKGMPALLDAIADPKLGLPARVKLWLQAASQLGLKNEKLALEVSEAVLPFEESGRTLRSCFWMSLKNQQVVLAKEYAVRIVGTVRADSSNEERERIEKIKANPVFQLTLLDAVPPRTKLQIESIPKRICYVLHNSLPFCSGGYAARAQGVADGMQQAGYDVVVITRPGFPYDIRPDVLPSAVPIPNMVHGIPHYHMATPVRDRTRPTFEYMVASADAMEAQLREHRPSLVMAASNYMTALPVLIAARRLGIPFIYEVRGLWEITRVSREKSFENTLGYHVLKIMESATAMQADRVFTLTEPMREELMARGVAPEQIDLLPNSCDPLRFLPQPRDAALAAELGIPEGVAVIGYVGTFVGYEGLDDLAKACGMLKKQGVAFRLLLVGNENTADNSRGSITDEIVTMAEKGGFTDWLIMPGRVPHEQVERYYSLIDIAPFPRKPWPVCEMVSPMKPLEALAMEKAVVVSNVRALAEMIADQKTGLLFEKGNVGSLAQVLRQLIENPALRRTLGQQGRQWVESERTWKKIGLKMSEIVTRSPELMV